MADIPQLSIELDPFGDRVIVMPTEKEKTTKSGLVIPETSSGDKPQEGTVLALGDGGIGKDCENPQDFLKVGDIVLFGKYAGDDVKVKDKSGKDVILKVLHLDSIACRVRQVS